MFDPWKKLPEEAASSKEDQLVSKHFSILANQSHVTKTLNSLNSLKAMYHILIEEGEIQVKCLHPDDFGMVWTMGSVVGRMLETEFTKEFQSETCFVYLGWYLLVIKVNIVAAPVLKCET